MEDEQQEEQQQEEQQQGGPDAAKAAEKYRQQRDEARTRAEDLERQIKAIKDKGDIDEVMNALEEEKAKSAEAAKKADSDRVRVISLAKEGCIDLEVALGLLDESGDVEALKEAKPYLFEAPKKGATGLKPDGSSGGSDDLRAEARKAAGIKIRKE